MKDETPLVSSIASLIFGLILAVYLVPGISELVFYNERRVPASETIARSALKRIQTAQLIFQELISLDRNRNGIGEYASDFMQLMGASSELSPKTQGTSQINMVPDSMDPALALKNGFIFRIYTSADLGRLDAAMDERQYAAVVWPEKFNKTGTKCYAIDETGIIYRFENSNGRFDGRKAPVLLTDLYGVPFDPVTIGQGGAAFTSAK